MMHLRLDPDPAKLARAHELWRSGTKSLNWAARYVGVSRDALRMRFPEFAAWREEKRRKSLRWHDDRRNRAMDETPSKGDSW